MRPNLASSVVVVCIAVIGFSPVNAVEGGPNSACPAIEDELVDLEMLASALHDTRVIGSIAKLRIRSDIRKLLKRMDAWHSGDRRYSLEEIQEQYDLVLMKTASHLQDRDSILHQKICNAWAPIWADLQNPQRVRDMKRSA